jgi:hypothetical protein
MTIAETREKCKSLIARVPRDVLILGVLLLASTLSFGLGYLAGLDAGQGSQITLEEPLTATSTTGSGAEQVVASKSGTKYYLPQCAGVDRISDTNKVWFASAAAAARAGYAPAANCKGL